MASSVKIVNNLPAFTKKLYRVMDDAIKEGASQVLIDAKENAPFLKGGLRANTDITSPQPLMKRVSFWIVYARYQELGGDLIHKIRHYTTPGTGAHYLKNAGDKQAKKLVVIFEKHARRV